MRNCLRWSLPLCIAAAVIGCAVCAMIPFGKGCKNLYDNMLRLHVIANSDTPRDQQLKLAVRDAVLRAGEAVFDGSADVRDAREKLVPAFGRLEQAAEDALRANGCGDPVKVTLEHCYFDTRTYGAWTVPAGRYEAVCVRIGRAAGQNWWCVMYPPLCLPAAEKNPDAVFDSRGKAVLGSSPQYDVRFKVVELYQAARRKIQKVK